MNRSKNRKNKTSGRRRNRKTSGRAPKTSQEGNLVLRPNPRFPSDIKMLPIHNRAIRYLISAALTDFQFTPEMLLKAVVGTVSGSTAAFTIIGSFRLRRVSMYYVPASNDFDASTNELVFEWLANLNAPSNMITDRGTATVPACIKVIPPPHGQAGFWFSSTSVNVTEGLFQLNAPAKTVLDIDFDYIVANGATTAVTLSSAAASSGVAFLAYNSNQIIPDGGGYVVRE